MQQHVPSHCYAVLAQFSLGYSPPEGRLSTCYAPVRHGCIATPVRLACVKHAASVRSEPGSNSRLKPDVTTVTVQDRYDRNELLNRSVSLKFPCPGTPETREKPPPPLLQKSGDNGSAAARRQLQKTGSGMYHRLSKSRSSQVNWKDYKRTPTIRKLL